MIDFEEEVDCKHCGTKTRMIGTGMCDRCWELDTRIRYDFTIAEKIFKIVEKELKNNE